MQTKIYLDSFFHPQTVALIGASDKLRSIGLTLIKNLSSFQGELYLVNPNRNSVLGRKCYPSLDAIGKPIDLAIIATPAKTVPEVLRTSRNVKSIVIISAGFKEIGASGLILEKKCQELLGPIRIIGPNSLGLQNPWINLNATFASDIALPGSISLISQSGAICTSILEWSFKAKIGFSSIVSVGSMMDVDFGDLINYLGDDPRTESILIYMETVGNADSFLKAAQKVSIKKPIIVLKTGRTQEAVLAVASHTGTLAGSDEVFNAAMKRVGVLRVDTLEDFFYMASLVSSQPKPQGPRLAIITNAGGPAILATDAAVLSGATIAKLSESTIKELNTFLPAAWSHQNPVDVLGDADALIYAKALKIVSADENVDGLLAILSPQDMTRPDDVAAEIINLQFSSKPLLASFMGGASMEKSSLALHDAGITTFPFPETAARLFAKFWQYSKITPALLDPVIQKKSIPLFDKILAQGRTLLTEEESKKLLSLYDIPTIRTEVAFSIEEAESLATDMGFPVVLKLHSKTITHKSDIGGVKLNLEDKAAVTKAFKEIQLSAREAFEGVTVQPMIKMNGYELIVGSYSDEQFGPVILFGFGGELVEIFKDKALAMAPLNRLLARELMEETRIYKALLGTRGREAIDIAALEEILIKFSRMILELPMIKECDINPLIVSPKGILALDARVVLNQ